MPIERAVFGGSSWDVFWTVPGNRSTSSLVPTAEFEGEQGTPGGAVFFDASNSDGAVAYTWDFGDGTLPYKTFLPTVSHAYSRAGTFLVILTVTNSIGVSAQANRSVSSDSDIMPVAGFVYEMDDMTISVDATVSVDRDGQIVSYEWDFGDGATAEEAVANHTYNLGGSYEVTLMVTDNQGASSMSTQTVQASFLPEAEFIVQSTDGLAVTFNASSAYDFNPIKSYSWSWGYAGSTDTNLAVPIVKHTFPADGTYPVTLTITDVLGRTDFVTHDIVAAKIVVPEPPLVQFSTSVTNLKVNVDASKTKDVDSFITEYYWDFGDGNIGFGVTTSHYYSTGGTYKITLRATDNLGMHASTAHSVTVSIPVPRLPPGNAGTVITEGRKLGMSVRDIEIGLMTALTESGLKMYANKNVPESLKYPHDAVGSDHDSLGIMQQRPSTGWGTVAQLMSVAYDAKAFFEALKRVSNRDNIKPWLAAQAVQRSAFSDGSNYEKNWSKAQSMYSSIVDSGPGGGDPGSGNEFRPTYDNANHRQIIAQDDYDPDESFRHHLQRGSAGGCDHNAPYGTPLYANCAGRVHTISLAAGGTGGRTINLYLGSTSWYDQYMHLSSFAVSDGQHVKQGQLIGHSGASGFGRDYGYAPHFHLHRYNPSGQRLNAYHYFGSSGTSNSQDHKPQRIVNTLHTGVPNATFNRRLQYFGKKYGGPYSFAYGCDGFMSIPAWKGVQYGLRSYGYKGSIDGVLGTQTKKALQLMAHDHGSNSSIDGSLSGADYKAISERLNLL